MVSRLKLKDIIRRQREAKGITQYELATSAGLSKDFGSMVENDLRTYHIDRDLPKIAKKLKLPLKDILQLAISEEYPKAAKILFADEDAMVAPIENLETLEKLNQLEPNTRESVINMIETLYQREGASRKRRA